MNGYSGTVVASAAFKFKKGSQEPSNLLSLYIMMVIYGRRWTSMYWNLTLKSQFREYIELACYVFWALATSLQPQSA